MSECRVCVVMCVEMCVVMCVVMRAMDTSDERVSGTYERMSCVYSNVCSNVCRASVNMRACRVHQMRLPSRS
jgi:hypothetical protein